MNTGTEVTFEFLIDTFGLLTLIAFLVFVGAGTIFAAASLAVERLERAVGYRFEVDGEFRWNEIEDGDTE